MARVKYYNENSKQWEYADGNNIAPSPSIAIDSTLTKSGEAADAKAVGDALANKQPKGEYLTAVPSGYATEEYVKNKIAEAELGGEEVDLSGYVQKSELPTKTSDLQNDSGFISKIPDEYITDEELNSKGYLTEHQSLDAYAKTADLGDLAKKDSLTASDVGADVSGTASSLVSEHNSDEAAHADIRELISELSGQNVELDSSLTQSGKAADAKATGDEIKRVEGKIPSIEGLAKEEDIPTKPGDIGAQPAGNYASPDDIPEVPNWAMQASKPAYTASEVGALPNTYTPPNQTAEQVGADPEGTAASEVSKHNTSTDAHTDLRQEIKAIREQLAAFLDVDEETLNELSELIARIVANQTSIAQLTTGKVNVSDIIDNLTTNVANKPLSAAQGVAIKALIDGLSASLANYQPKGNYALASDVPTKVSQLANDKGYLTQHQDISGKLDADKLPEAVEDALAQAKASGEFDGEDGDPGDPGRGIKTIARTSGNGAAGTVDTYTITYTDNTTGTFQVRNGSNGTAATFAITGATELAYGAAPTVTEQSGSTAQARKYIIGIPAGKPGADYVLTDEDRAQIAAMVIDDLGGRPVYGYVDESTKAVVLINAPGGEYTYYYEMEDGTLVEIGKAEEDNTVYYSVTNTLTNCTSSNSATQAVEGGSYSATIAAKSGYALKSVTVTMGGSPVTVSGGTISIANVIGNIVITAVAEEIKVNYTNLANPASADWANGKRFDGSGNLKDVDAGVNGATTNYIGGGFAVGDTIRIKGMDLSGSSYRTAVYNKNKELQSLATLSGQGTYFSDIVVNSTGASFKIKSNMHSDGYIRFSGVLNGASEDVIITKNEEIV